MREKSESIFYNVDWFTVVIYLILITMGWFNIYSAVYDEAKSSVFSIGRIESKQLIFVIIAIILSFSILIIDASFFTATAYILFGGIIFLNIAVVFLGTDIRGSHSWFKFGGMSLQPAEFAKWATLLALAKFLGNTNSITDRKTQLFTAGIILLPVLIMVALQKETGCALVFFSLVLVLYREGMVPGWILFFGLLSATVAIVGIKYENSRLWIILALSSVAAARLLFVRRNFRNIMIGVISVAVLSGIAIAAPKIMEKVPEHQSGRIRSWLGLPVTREISDRFDYNTRQSMIAIGSGGWTGKGYLQGTQTKFRFVPEQETDFIFCTVGEEWGFLGTGVVILLYLILIIRIVFMAERQRSDFTRIYGYGVAAIFFIHLIVNVGMTIGLLPVIGIPLPFFSYGGSSLISFTILLFIFIKLDSQRLLILR